MIAAVSIFVVAYLMIAWEKVNKTLIALLGASLMLICHILPQDVAMHHIDFNVITLLISMMVLVSIVEQTGVFEFVAIKLAKLVGGSPIKILVMLFLITAVFSALLDNITTVLLIAPVSVLIAEELRISPLPFLLSQIFASNIGGTATLIGDPPNIMIGSAAGLTFMDFVINVAPLVLVQLLIVSVLFYFLFGGQMRVSNEDKARIMAFDERRSIKDTGLLFKSLFVLGLVILGFAIHGFVDLEAATIAMAGASVLMIVGKIDAEQLFGKVEWSSIFFFTGLFIMVGGLVEVGVISFVSRRMLAFTHGNVHITAQVLLWFSGVASAVVDNIPFVATMIPLLQDVQMHLGGSANSGLWWALSLGSCLGGNGSLIGASANIIVANMAMKTGNKIGFVKFLKYGIPITVLLLAISHIYLMLRYF